MARRRKGQGRVLRQKVGRRRTKLEEARAAGRKAADEFGLAFAQLSVLDGSVTPEPLAWSQPPIIGESRVAVAEVTFTLHVPALPAKAEADLHRSSSAEYGIESAVSSAAAETGADLGEIVSNSEHIILLGSAVNRVLEANEACPTFQDMHRRRVGNLPSSNDNPIHSPSIQTTSGRGGTESGP